VLERGEEESEGINLFGRDRRANRPTNQERSVLTTRKYGHPSGAVIHILSSTLPPFSFSPFPSATWEILIWSSNIHNMQNKGEGILCCARWGVILFSLLTHAIALCSFLAFPTLHSHYLSSSEVVFYRFLSILAPFRTLPPLKIHRDSCQNPFGCLLILSPHTHPPSLSHNNEILSVIKHS
jgi:hypothetical protein